MVEHMTEQMEKQMKKRINPKQEEITNYEKLCLEWAGRFLDMDEEALCRKLPELTRKGEYLIINHFGRKCGINRQTGEIVPLDNRGDIRVTAKLNIYTLIWFSKEHAMLLDKWVPFAELRDARPFAPAYKKGVTDVFSQTFSGHAKELAEACKKLGGTPLPQGDVGFQINAFACMPVRIHFWDADEEFPAQGNILFDYSATDYNHIESAVSIAEESIVRLAEEAGVAVRGHSFQMR